MLSMKLVLSSSTVNSKVNKLLTLLSSDPGSSNYGYAVVQFNKTDDRLKFRVIENGLCHSTVNGLKDSKVLATQLKAYEQFLIDLRNKFKVDALCAERYMTRGINGPTVEYVNFMLGVMIQSSQLPVRLWPAVVWKNAMKRAGVDLKYWYKYCRATPHQLDAVLIAIYTGHFAYGYKDFGDTPIEKLMPTIIDQVEATTCEKLFNRKLRKE